MASPAERERKFMVKRATRFPGSVLLYWFWRRGRRERMCACWPYFSAGSWRRDAWVFLMVVSEDLGMVEMRERRVPLLKWIWGEEGRKGEEGGEEGLD